MHTVLDLSRRALGLLVLMVAVTHLVAAPAAADEAEDERVQKLVAEFDQLLAAGQGQQAIQHLERVRQRHAKHPLVLTAQGRLLLLQNNVQGAMAALTQALEKQPHQPVATALLANLDFRMGRGEQAQQRIDAALELHPDSPELLLIDAQIKVAKQELAEAQPLFKKVADNTEAPKDLRAQAYAQIGSYHIQRGKPAEAVEALATALTLQWHPDIALAHVVQLEKTGDTEGTLRAINDFTAKLNYQQFAQIRDRAMQQLRPIERRALIKKIDAMLAEGDHAKAKGEIDSLNRLFMKDAAVWRELGPAMRRLEIIQRTLLLEEGLEKGNDISWLGNMIFGIKNLSHDQQGEHMVKANAAMAKAQERIDAAEALEIPAVLELAKDGITIAELEYPDDDLKKVLEEKGLKPYKQLSAAAKEALREHFEPLAAARQAPPFEKHIRPFLEYPGNETMRNALITSFMEHAGTYDVTAEGAAYQELIPDWVWTKSGKSGPQLPADFNLNREKAYTAWNNFGAHDLRKAGKWDEVIAGYDRAAAIYPRREILLNRAQVYFFAGNLQAAYEEMALCAAVTMYELACSYRRSASDLRADVFALQNLGQAQALRALAEGRRVVEGPGTNAAVMDALEHIRNERWIPLAEFVSAEHPEGSLAAWCVSQLRWGDFQHKTPMLDALAAAAQATNDAERQAYLTKLAEPLGSYAHPIFMILKARAAEDDESRLKLLETAVAYSPRHAESNVMLAQLMEKRGQSRAALVQYNVGAMGLTVAELKEADRQEAARQRDRLAQQLRGSGRDWDLYLGLHNEYYKMMYANQRDKRAAARSEALLTRLLGLNAKRLQILLTRADARRFIADWQGAIDDLEEAMPMLETEEPLPVIHSALAACHLELGQTDQAMTFLTKAIDGGNKTLFVFHKRGDLHRSAGNTEAAVADFTAALEINGEDTYSLQKRSEIYEYELEDYDKALADLKKLEELLKKADRSTMVVSMRILSVTRHLLDRAFSP